jgi:hypothetical protein
MSQMKFRLRESVKGLARPLANVDNRRRIGVVSVVLAIGPASFLLGPNTK